MVSIYESICNAIDLALDSEDMFEVRILSEISDAFATLSQLTKVKSLAVINIDKTTTYDDVIDVLPDDVDKESLMLLMDRYIKLCVRISFDPPMGNAYNTLDEIRRTLEYRIVVNLERSQLE